MSDNTTDVMIRDVPDKIVKALDHAAEREHRSREAQLRFMLEQWFDELVKR